MNADVLRLFGTPTLSLAGSRRQEALQWHSHIGLIALLACVPGWHSRESLAALIRPDAAPAVARAYLRRLLHRARALLPQMTALEIDATRVRWNGGSDVAAFDQAVARKEWQAAVSLHRSPFLQSVGTTGQDAIDDWFHETRVRLAGAQQMALLALMTQLYPSSEVDLSEFMQQLAENSPLDESCIQFLLLHARTPLEKHTAATAYHVFERRMEQELAAKPRPETLALFRELQGRSGSAPAAPNRTREAQEERIGAIDELPDYGDEQLLGRGHELELLRELLTENEARLIAIHGMGGIGKTRLARRLYDDVATEVPKRALWVSLESCSPQHDLMSIVASRLGVAGPRETAESRVVDRLRGQKTILFLDGFEALIADTDGLARLVDRARDLRCVVTTRQAIRLPQERLLLLNGLDWDGTNSEAARLFHYHAGRSGYLQNDADGAAVCQLVGYLEGHPLAIELAAAWAPLLPVKSILLELKKDFRFIDAPTSRTLHGRKDLREIFEAEWARLDSAEQTALSAISALEGRIDLAAARATIGDDGPSTLLRLANKSLLGRAADGSLTIHPLLRQFVRSKAQPSS
ncbi:MULTISPECIES: AfsR/SARP family transcriptional regulator [Variovorax]|uniref:AfsR/SARP family transcriptional regulator n=1 Tax=Variovorax TaxID=34072 RepID=UPI0028564C1A|nr:NB-ARC domain-containing protein [Variovorax sp. 3319]MDR6890703.1 DNA-binding SARP family transcriptional activator [Variovorax sp. 3319]